MRPVHRRVDARRPAGDHVGHVRRVRRRRHRADQTFRTATRDIAIGIGSDKLWRTFCPLLDRAELADDPRFVTNAARNRNRAALIDILQAALLTRSYEEWEAILMPAGIPVGAINTLDQVAAHPQAQARGVFVDNTHPVAGTVKMVGPPVRMTETPGSVRTPAPLLGEHTAEVLRDRLGMTVDEITRLHQARVIVARPTSRDAAS